MTLSEQSIVTGLNAMFERHGIAGIAYRLKQARYTAQPVDLLVDSPHREFYLAIECKSIALDSGAAALYFSQHFHRGAQVSQVADFCGRTGRRGLLAVTLRRGVGRDLSTHLLPWEQVLARVRDGPGWRVEEIEGWPEVPREGRGLRFEPGMFSGVGQ